MAKVRSLYARQDSDMVVRVVAKDTDGAGWRYELAFSHDTLKNPRPVVVRELVDRQQADGTEQRKLTRPDEHDRRDRERLTQTALQQVTASQEFRELAELIERCWRPEQAQHRSASLRRALDAIRAATRA